MENAARGVLEALAQRFGTLKDRSISLVCGKGNNGGDGLALARMLGEVAARPRVFLFASAADLKELAQIQYQRLQNLGNSAVQEIHSQADWDRVLPEIKGSACLVDALLGTGISKPLQGLLLYAVESMNLASVPKVAVDIPSGLFSDDVATRGPCFRADVTITFTAPKIGMVLGPNAGAVGEMIVVPIGTPAELVEECGSQLSLSTAELLKPFQQPRPLFSHKGDFGKILVVAGSRGKSGAAMLAGLGALRAGAGLVTLGVPAQIQDAVMAAAPVELMTEGLPGTRRGVLSAGAGKEILRLLKNFDVIAIGPGLGTAPGTVSAIFEVVEQSPVPIIADADAINALAAKRSRWKSKSTLVLTPHLGEMGRLAGKSIDQVFADRINLCSSLAKRKVCYLVLKGYRTLVSDPRGEIWVNTSGNPGMATAGSGDVLTGIIAAFVARNNRRQLTSAHNAIAAAVYAHGAAGDVAKRDVGEASLIAGDIIRSLPEVLR
jgi:NAD(P)H-hydrate epimerase